MGKYTHYYYSPVKAALAKRQYVLNMLLLLGLPLLFVLSLATGFLIPKHAAAAAYTWDGGGTTNNWSDCTNWSSNICPTSGDTVTFNSTSTKNSTVDASFGGTVTSVTITTGYTGTVSLGRSLTTSGVFTQSTGTFTAGANNLTIGTTFTLSGGNFTASSGTTQVNGALTVSGTPTFNANGGTFAFGGTTATTLSCNNITFNAATLVNTGTGSSAKTVSSNCNLPLGANPSLAGAVTLNGGTLTGSGTLTTVATLTFASGATPLVGFSGYNQTGGTTSISTGMSVSFSSYSSFSANTFTQQTGSTFTAPSGIMQVKAGFTISGATFNANGGTVDFSGGSATLACGNASFNLVTFNKTGSSAITIGSDCSLPLGSNPTPSLGTGSVVLDGTLSGSGTFTKASASLQLNSTAALSGFSGIVSSGTFTLNGATINMGNYTTVDFNGAFIAQTGTTFTAPSGTATFASTFTLNSGSTFNANSGTVTFDGGTATLACNNTTFSLVTIATNGTKTVGSDCNLILGSNPTISGGGTLTLNGTLTGSGTLNANALILNAGSVFSGFTGLTTTSALTVNSTINFGSYVPFDINGTFVLNSGGVFTAPSGTATFSSTFTLNSGSTFNANGGTITFDGATSGTISCNNITFSSVSIVHSNGTKTVNSDCSLPLGSNPTVGQGTGARLTLNGTLTGSGLLTIGTAPGTTRLTLASGGNIAAFSGLVVTENLTVGGTYNFSSFSPFTVLANFTVSSTGGFTAPSGAMDVGTDFAINPGSTYASNGGTLNLTGAGTTACNNTYFTLVRVQQTSGTREVGADCSLPLGANPQLGGGGSVRLYGTLSGSGTLTQPSRLTLKPGYTLQGFVELSLGALTVDAGTNADFSAFSPLSVNLNTVTADPGLYILGGATLKLPAGTTSVASQQIVNDGGTLDPNGGTVVLTGTDQTFVGNLAFHNLTKESPGSVLTFAAGGTVTVSGQLKLQGSTSSPLALVSSTPGTPWDIASLGTNNICYISVTDSNSTNNTLVAYQSNSYSTNNGWAFLNSACPGTGGGGSTGGGGEPTSTTTNYVAAQAAAAAAAASASSGGTAATQLPGAGIPRRLSGIMGAIPGGDKAIKAFLRFLLILTVICAVGFGLWWFFTTRKRQDQYENEDTNLYHPVGY